MNAVHAALMSVGGDLTHLRASMEQRHYGTEEGSQGGVLQYAGILIGAQRSRVVETDRKLAQNLFNRRMSNRRDSE